MREYELTVILNPGLEGKELDAEVKAVQAILDKAGAKITSKSDPVKKALAYEIAKNKEGQYAFYAISLEPSNVAEVESKIKLQDSVIRYLLVSK